MQIFCEKFFVETMLRKIKDLGDDKPKNVESFEHNRMYSTRPSRPRTGGDGVAPPPSRRHRSVRSRASAVITGFSLFNWLNAQGV